MSRNTRTAFKYTLVQLPSWLLMAAIMFLLRHWFALPLWLVWTVIAFWVAKDAALFPLMRRAYEPGERTFGSLIGERGTSRERLAPSGYILVRGELWRAEVQGGRGVEAGEEVEVQATRGLTLLVRPAEKGKGN